MLKKIKILEHSKKKIKKIHPKKKVFENSQKKNIFLGLEITIILQNSIY